ncbi:hypothetical protein OGATHE_001720 [Ogataea polymorpha]|uniref:Uncharacterized protein n=1 Tax=Ogataea polymorpha TaxID=460523 RepID=A0A9P8TE89_9ASCO|nr:hypothetical protein OGATHE_001720 [Ogataea polymorpha]
MSRDPKKAPTWNREMMLALTVVTVDCDIDSNPNSSWKESRTIVPLMNPESYPQRTAAQDAKMAQRYSR